MTRPSLPPPTFRITRSMCVFHTTELACVHSLMRPVFHHTDVFLCSYCTTQRSRCQATQGLGAGRDHPDGEGDNQGGEVGNSRGSSVDGCGRESCSVLSQGLQLGSSRAGAEYGFLFPNTCPFVPTPFILKFIIFSHGWEEVVCAKRIAHARIPGCGKEPEELKESLCGLYLTRGRAREGAALGKEVTGLAAACRPEREAWVAFLVQWEAP